MVKIEKSSISSVNTDGKFDKHISRVFDIKVLTKIKQLDTNPGSKLTTH